MMKCFCLFLFMLVCPNVHVDAQEPFMEHLGDRYIIHVDQIEPDSEMTLSDLLLMCPQMLSTDGKSIMETYALYIEGVSVMTDSETLMENVKACELSTVEICCHPSVSLGEIAMEGSIDIYFKEDVKGTRGKAAIAGATNGNGKLYADIAGNAGRTSLRGFALTNLKRDDAAENVFANARWNISDRDVLNFDFVHSFSDKKLQRTFLADEDSTSFYRRQQLLSSVFTYTRTLWNEDATLMIESYQDYWKSDDDEDNERCYQPTLNAEMNFPLFDRRLSVLLGWEAAYSYDFDKQEDKGEVLYNELYCQLEYKHKGWVFNIGDRSCLKNDCHAWMLSAGRQQGSHFVQGTFSHDYHVAGLNHSDEQIANICLMRKLSYDSIPCFRGELNYCYQQKSLVLSGNLVHTWSKDEFDGERLRSTGIKVSATWRCGRLRTTLGADFFHEHLGGHDNYFHLKAAPILLLGSGFRLSSTVIYSSKRPLFDVQDYLYASVKVNKQLGNHFNVYALADNSAWTLGATYRF